MTARINDESMPTIARSGLGTYAGWSDLVFAARVKRLEGPATFVGISRTRIRVAASDTKAIAVAEGPYSNTGVNVAMISYYFGSKEKLFESLEERKVLLMRERLENLSLEIADPLERMLAIADLYLGKMIAQSSLSPHCIPRTHLAATRRCP